MPSRRNRTLLLFVLGIFLVFFRARWAFRPGIYDEECYIEWLHRFLFLDYPQCYSTSHPGGIAAIWFPVGLIARLTSAVTAIPFKSVALPLIAFQTFALWGAAVFLIDRVARRISGPDAKIPVWWPMLMLLNAPLLEYAARSTFWTHTSEIVLCLLIYLGCLRNRFVIAFALGGLLLWIRINDAPIFLVVLGMMVDAHRRGTWRPSSREVRIWQGLVGSAALVVGAAVIKIGFVSGYNGMDIPTVLRGFSFDRIYGALTWPTDGLFYMAGWYLAVLGVAAAQFRKLSWMGRASALWMLAELGLVIGLNGIREDYRSPVTRYLLGSFSAAFAIWFECAPRLAPYVKKALTALLILYAVWIPYQMFTYDAMVVNHFNATWFPPDYMLNRLQLLTAPLLLLKMLGLSPVGFTVYSHFADTAAFQPLQAYKPYALVGAELWLLTLVSVAAVGAVAWLLWPRR